MMKQVLYSNYGTSSVLKVEEKEKPRIGKKNSILIKMQYSSLNAIDWKNRKGDFRLVSGLIKPRTKQGFDVVGIIEEKTNDVTNFDIGDKVVGLLGNFKGGSLSEYIVVKADSIVKIPDDIPIKQVAGIPMAGTTAWLALLKLGGLKKNDKVLINGGSSGVGHIAIQIAKAYGAEVTSVSSTKNLDFCKHLGADTTISYQNEDFLKSTSAYDIIFDVVFNASYQKTKHLLTQNGTYIGTTPTGAMLKELVRFKRAKFVTVHPNKEALKDLLRLMKERKVKVEIDKEFLLDDIINAHNSIEKSRTVGKIVIKMSGVSQNLRHL
nr:NAD(P)-dependent alcohol dehydrogenase [uncultured Draconibacterium sp.]